MSDDIVPVPTVMPINREEWRRRFHLSNFVNAYYQYRDIQSLQIGKKILIIGPGQGFDTQVFRWTGHEVVTFDIDETFEPDVVGSVHDMPMFRDDQFDVAIASHVLEHFAVAYLDRALAEIARVAGHALIYLPVAGRHLQLRFVPEVTRLDVSVVIDLFNYFDRPDGRTAKYGGGQHFWELGRPGYRLGEVRERLQKSFRIIHDYRNRDWLSSHNFVLNSRRG